MTDFTEYTKSVNIHTAEIRENVFIHSSILDISAIKITQDTDLNDN